MTSFSLAHIYIFFLQKSHIRVNQIVIVNLKCKWKAVHGHYTEKMFKLNAFDKTLYYANCRKKLLLTSEKREKEVCYSATKNRTKQKTYFGLVFLFKSFQPCFRLSSAYNYNVNLFFMMCRGRTLFVLFCMLCH